jgi:hypothetical protein
MRMCDESLLLLSKTSYSSVFCDSDRRFHFTGAVHMTHNMNAYTPTALRLSLGRRTSGPEPEQTGTSQPLFKKQRLYYPESRPPPAFWDNLTKLWLTERALRELDRRNSQITPSLSHSPYRYGLARQPVTRNSIAEQKNNCQLAYCTEYLFRCTPGILRDIGGEIIAST